VCLSVLQSSFVTVNNVKNFSGGEKSFGLLGVEAGHQHGRTLS